jgi:hypothetical protein
MSMLHGELTARLLHAGPATSGHWWADWSTPILSIVIALLLVGMAVTVYFIEKKRLRQERV